MRIPNPFKADINRPVQRVSVPRWVASVVLAFLIVFVIAGTWGYVLISDIGTSNQRNTTCLNTNLGARSKPGYDLTQAQLVWGRAERVWARAEDDSTRAQNETSGALFNLLNAPKAQQVALFASFLKTFANGQAVAISTRAALNVYITSLDTYVSAISDVKAAQAAHPLGKC